MFTFVYVCLRLFTVVFFFLCCAYVCLRLFTFIYDSVVVVDGGVGGSCPCEPSATVATATSTITRCRYVVAPAGATSCRCGSRCFRSGDQAPPSVARFLTFDPAVPSGSLGSLRFLKRSSKRARPRRCEQLLEFPISTIPHSSSNSLLALLPPHQLYFVLFWLPASSLSTL